MTTALSNQPLLKDRAFWGLNATQFLGAFNDNLFKQMVMLICVAAAANGGPSLVGAATTAFAVPFIFLSGFAGFLSDRFSKRSIAYWCKVAEVVLVLAGMVGFWANSVPFLIIILSLFGAHSAMFGPPKYGILPELFHKPELPKANGLLLMTTFLAIIFGISIAGVLMDFFVDNRWLASVACLVVALLGLVTVLFLRDPGPADPSLKFNVESLFVSRATWQLIRVKPNFLSVLIASSTFWMVGGMIYPGAIDEVGPHVYGLDNKYTSLLAASTGLGIAFGCVAAGLWCRDKIRGRLVMAGIVGLILCLILLGMPGSEGFRGPPLLGAKAAGFVLMALGMFAGFFSVPLQTFLQAMASDGQKGRIIGVMNLVNWIGIALAGVIYSAATYVLKLNDLSVQYTFWVGAAILLPLVIVFRPPTVNLSDLEKHPERDLPLPDRLGESATQVATVGETA
ncbi:MFS transporter [Planctopirus hydrillae]|uniref:Major facilitator superfamily (MFS) profile domain-containing protein n=1 Tax=Planctopirus hydrillae TaxID=1841610 RepID=A0A1C3ENL3_9PLAN|nr:MFS transporter [Planctopirus hydrillae]ODA34812.1 hypothetical protein A6X21_03920 [Planctopirus hydrillae]